MVAEIQSMVVRCVVRGFAVLLLGCTHLLGHAQPISQSVRLPNQEYAESRQDIAVKVLGGYVAIHRTWASGRWYLNPAWANLRLIPDPMGGILAVQRASVIYERTGSKASQGTGSIYRFDADNYIEQTLDGWRWYDRLGNSVRYDSTGMILGYSDPNGVQVSFSRDVQGRMTAINDHHGRTALTLQSDGEGRITRVSDADGRSVSYQWSGSGASSQLTQVTDLLGQMWKYEYNGQGQITRRTNPLGAALNLTYMSSPTPLPDSPGFAGMGAGSGSGSSGDPASAGATASSGQTRAALPPVARVASLQDETGATTLYRVDYDRVRQQYTTHSQDPSGATRRRSYNKNGLLLQDSTNDQLLTQRIIDSPNQDRYVDARGQTTTTQYDNARRPLLVIHPDGSQESYQYDGQGRIVRYTNALSVISTWAYDAQGNQTEYVEALGLPEQRTTRRRYDRYGQVISRTRGAIRGQGADALENTYDYDSAGNVIKTTNALGHSTTATYINQGKILTQVNPLGYLDAYAYDAAGNLLSSTNVLGQITRHSYDRLGSRTQTITAAGRISQTVFDIAGRLIEQRQPGQAIGTKVSYDAAGRTITTTSPGGLTSTNIYDALDRVVQITDPTGNSIKHEYGSDGTPLAGLLTKRVYPTYTENYLYDQRGRQTKITQILGGTTTSPTSLVQHHAFDALGQRIGRTDPAGNSTLYRYDALGRLVETVDSLNQRIKQIWDAHDRLIAVTDFNGNNHRFEYDQVGRLIKEIRPMGGCIEYSYNAVGQLTQRVDAGGNIRAYARDPVGRTILEEHRLQGSAVDQRISRQYDSDGFLTAYDQQDGGSHLVSNASYVKDAQGRTVQSVITYGKADGSVLAFTIGQSYNDDGQLVSHTYPDGSKQTYVYDRGRLVEVILPNQSRISYQEYQWMQPARIETPGVVKIQSFDALQRHTRIEVKSGRGQLLAYKSYQYDLAGNATEIESDLGSTKYVYDEVGRLVRVEPDNSLRNLGVPQEQYSYGSTGNRASSSHQPGVWSYNGDNQLLQYPRTVPFNDAPPKDTSVTFTPQGHMAQEKSGTWSRDYRYNAAERLIEITQGSQTVKYLYDPLGQRISKSSDGTAATYYLYSDTGLMAEIDNYGQLTKAYGFNPQTVHHGLWSTDPLWQADVTSNNLTSNATIYHYLHTDRLGTPLLATDKEGNATWRAVTEAFGAAKTVVQATEMNLRLPGQYWDQETNSHYNFQRDYRPDIGRYVQSDPIGLAGGINSFVYARNSPTSNIDPTGLVQWSGSTFSAAYVPGKGGVAVMYRLETACVCNRKVSVNGVALMGALGIGAKLTGSAGPSNFEDGKSCPDPGSPNGLAYFGSIGAQAGDVSWGRSILVMGALHQTDSATFGFDFSGTAALGFSMVLDSKIEECCSSNQG